MHKFTFALLVLSLPLISIAQPTAEIKNIRIYEHHSSSINQNLPYGYGANGSTSGYDFVNNVYYGSFNPTTMGSWTTEEQANIDMVEHNGCYNDPFGLTSATSSIWAGDIKGNDITVYAEAPAGFVYDSANDASYIKDAIPASTSKEIAEVVANKVYLAKIRNMELYVAIKVTNVKNISPNTSPGVDPDDVYFDFDYKYGYYFPTGVQNVAKNEDAFSIYPNPAKGNFQVKDLPQQLNKNIATVRIVDMTGKTVYAQSLSSIINCPTQAGNYFVLVSDGNHTEKGKLVIAE
ncbi:MAG: T9SS type A sorting domain-containing protein [Sphingobacteriales bacterium]|nr:MAG: T9SS type A sorting domain-containing protein [Sphingobacteriales bacterium]